MYYIYKIMHKGFCLNTAFFSSFWLTNNVLFACLSLWQCVFLCFHVDEDFSLKTVPCVNEIVFKKYLWMCRLHLSKGCFFSVEQCEQSMGNLSASSCSD